ncbi:DUF4142 domain-containing protein [Telluribacter humicola]|uniref:DUF4142 domain-containing protein n=1 Tax=Telluribacter humicola TaxID=1720261 RepID=UPI001A967E79|nr:DUF4142 domain-containing protein [Telluribacter humicola]
MRKLKWNLLLLAGMFMAVSCNNDNDDDNMVAEVDREFAVAAAESNLMGVRTGQLVQANAMSQDVKDYSTAMAEYYNTATTDLADLAGRRNISLPTTLGTMNQQDYDRLAALQGADFDSAYVDWAVRSNQQSIDMLRAHMDATSDAEFRNWASSRITTLEQNQQMVESIQETMNEEMTEQ